MKKLLLSAIALASATFATAQISIDWSVDQIELPTNISSSTSGTTVSYKVILKNLGTDSVLVGDTLLYQVVMLNAANQVIVAVPNGSFSYKLMNRKVLPNDTIQLLGGFNINGYPTASVDIKFRVISYVINRQRGLALEGTSSNTNNTKEKSMIWFNPQGWPVSVNTPVANAASVYPNIAGSTINVSLPVVSTVENTIITITDFSGKLVKTVIVPSGENKISIDTEGMSNGSYIISTNSSIFQHSSVVVISK